MASWQVVRWRSVLAVAVALPGLSLLACSGPPSTGPAELIAAVTTSDPPPPAGVSQASLQLLVSENSCNPYEAQSYFDVQNNGSSAVPLSSLSIKYWIFDTSGQQIATHVWYGGCVVDQGGSCVHPVTGTTIAAQQLSGCGPTDKANWEITVTTTDTFAMPPGFTWSNLQTAINEANYTPFTPGTSQWFSSCGNGQPYAPNGTFALLENQQLVYSPSFGLTAPACRSPHGSQQLSGYINHSTNAGTPALEHLPPSTPVRLAIGFPIQDNNGAPDIITFINQVSDPKSPQYRQYLSVSTFADNYGLDAADFAAVGTFAAAHNLSVVESAANRLVVFVVGAASDVEQTFFTTLNVYARPDGTLFIAPDREPSVNLTSTVGYVGGLDDFQVAKPAFSGGTAPGSLLGPSDLHGAYAGCSAAKSLDGSGQSVSIVAFDGYNGCDISKNDPNCSSPSTSTGYVDQFGLASLTGAAPTVNRTLLDDVAGDIQGTSGGQETTSDIQMVLAMAPAAQVNVVESHWGVRSVGSLGSILSEGTGYYETHILHNIATASSLSSQVNCSWIIDDNSNNTNAALEFVAQGQSFFYASGDLNLAHGLDGYDTLPYLTAVGGTELSVSGGTWSAEAAWANSDGGVAGPIVSPFQPLFVVGLFPGVVPLPSYQINIGGQASTAFRNVPDVAAPANGLYVWYNQGRINWTGTSASAPLWAGFMALANQQAAKSGLLPVGFANPVLYDLARSPALYGADFHDITSGTQAADGYSYSAAAGYDLVTGLGSPQCNLIPQLGSVDPLAPPHRLRIVANLSLPSSDSTYPSQLESADGQGLLSAPFPPPASTLQFGVEDFVTRTTNGGLGGDTDSSGPTIDITCDPGAGPSATVFYSDCVIETNGVFSHQTSTDPTQDQSLLQSGPVGSGSQFTMTVTCNHANAVGDMNVQATYQLWNGCGPGRIPTGHDPGNGDFSVESGGGCGFLGLGQCFNNTSRRTMQFLVQSQNAVVADPNVCFEVKTHFNNANGCDDNHMRTDAAFGSPPAGLAFISVQQ